MVGEEHYAADGGSMVGEEHTYYTADGGNMVGEEHCTADD